MSLSANYRCVSASRHFVLFRNCTDMTGARVQLPSHVRQSTQITHADARMNIHTMLDAGSGSTQETSSNCVRNLCPQAAVLSRKWRGESIRPHGWYEMVCEKHLSEQWHRRQSPPVTFKGCFAIVDELLPVSWVFQVSST